MLRRTMIIQSILGRPEVRAYFSDCPIFPTTHSHTPYPTILNSKRQTHNTQKTWKKEFAK